MSERYHDSCPNCYYNVTSQEGIVKFQETLYKQIEEARLCPKCSPESYMEIKNPSEELVNFFRF